MSRILSRISMLTGQISSQALHEVQDHSSSEVMRSNRLSAETVMSGSTADWGRYCTVGAGGRHDLAGLEHDLAWVERLAGGMGRTDRGAAATHGARVGVEQLLPGEVGDRRWPRRSSPAPFPSGLGMAFMAPFGRSLSFRYMFSGDVNMCRIIVIGRMMRRRQRNSARG